MCLYVKKHVENAYIVNLMYSIWDIKELETRLQTQVADILKRVPILTSEPLKLLHKSLSHAQTSR